jgi:hypothetical protein
MTWVGPWWKGSKLFLPFALASALMAACGDSSESDTTGSGGQGPGPGASVGNGGGGTCGDERCEGGETCSDCPGDCGPCGSCGDERCDAGETCRSCEADCGACDPCGECDPDCSMGPECGGVVMETGVPAGEPGGSGVTPGGMAAGYFDLPVGSYEAHDAFFTIESEPPAGSHYFWAHQFFFDGGDGGYTGLQAEGLIQGVWVGKMAIFSVWETTEALPGAGASCEMFGGEGEGMSCRKAFAWEEGKTYRHRVERVAGDPLWWRVVVRDLEARSEWELGRIKVPDAWGPLEWPGITFTEYYLQVDACTTVPHARVRFGPLFGNGGAVPVEAISAMTYGTCAAQATATCLGDACL